MELDKTTEDFIKISEKFNNRHYSHVVEKFMAVRANPTHIFWGETDDEKELVQKIDLTCVGEKPDDGFSFKIGGIPLAVFEDTPIQTNFEVNYTEWNLNNLLQDAKKQLYFRLRFWDGAYLSWSGKYEIFWAKIETDGVHKLRAVIHMDAPATYHPPPEESEDNQ